MKQVFHVEYGDDLPPYDYEQERLSEIGAELSTYRCADGDEIVARAGDAEVLWLEWTPNIDRAVLEALPQVRLAMRWGAGYDQIDIGAATELGIAVANAPNYCTQNVAEHAMGLLLAMTRGIANDNESMRAGGWRRSDVAHLRLAGHTLGVVGMGRIGRRVAELANAFGCRVLAFDVRHDLVAPPGVELVALPELVAQADYLSIHVPLSPQTRHLVDAELLGLVKEGAFLVNTSRGPIVDQAALLAAIDSGRLAGAGLDVFEREPLPPDSELRTRRQIVLTPHEASGSPEAVLDLRKEMCDSTIEWFEKGWTGSIVNPEVRSRLRGARP